MSLTVENLPSDSDIIMLKDSEFGSGDTLSITVCLIVMPRVLHTHRCITSSQLNSTVPSGC